MCQEYMWKHTDFHCHYFSLRPLPLSLLFPQEVDIFLIRPYSRTRLQIIMDNVVNRLTNIRVVAIYSHTAVESLTSVSQKITTLEKVTTWWIIIKYICIYVQNMSHLMMCKNQHGRLTDSLGWKTWKKKNDKTTGEHWWGAGQSSSDVFVRDLWRIINR